MGLCEGDRPRRAHPPKGPSKSLDCDYEAELLDACEIDADEERLAYYRARYAEQAGPPR